MIINGWRNWNGGISEMGIGKLIVGKLGSSDRQTGNRHNGKSPFNKFVIEKENHLPYE